MTASRFRDLNRKNPRARRRRILETLEPRCLLASLGGEVFLDSDGNNQRGAEEVAAAGVIVYLDSNDNAQQDVGELSTITDDNGQFLFDNLTPDSYIVRLATIDTPQTSPTGYLGTGFPGVTGGVGASPTQLFEMTLDGDVHVIGSQTTDRIHDLVRTNDGIIIGVNHVTDGIYSVDPLTGQETLLVRPGDDLVAGLAYDPATDTIYTVSQENGLFGLRTIDKTTGQLGPITASAGHNVRAINFGSTFFDFDVAAQTAVAVPRQTLSPFASTLDTNSEGSIFGLQGRALNRYSFPAAGSTAVTLSTLSRSIESISFNASDQLFGVSTSPSALHQINPTTGAVGPGVPITFAGSSISGITGFDIGPDGTHYVVDSTHLYTFDPVTGIATQSPNRALPTSSPIFTSLSVGTDGSLFATLFNTDTPLASIDPATGLATRLGNSPLGAPYASAVVESVPTGLVGLMGVSDLAFDTVNQRIVGFADGNDQFFSFDTDGVGTMLAQAQQSLNSSSLAFDGTSFVMFDQDDAAKRAVINVDPENGAISPGVTASLAVPTEGLFHSKIGDFPYRIDLADVDLRGVDFGVLGATPPGPEIYINELLLSPLFGNSDTDQYVELRGPAGGQIPENTYLVIVDEDNINRGEIHGIFDLSNQPLGANGFLVLLQENNIYQVDPASAVLESTLPGFGGLPGGIYTDSHPLSDRIDFILGPNGYFLIQTETPPQLGDDIDIDDDGFADPTGLKSQWDVIDSLSVHPLSAGSSQAYGDVLLRRVGSGTNPIITEPGVEIVNTTGSGYAGRIGDSIGSSADDWIHSTVIEAESDPVTGRTTVYELESGIFGVPVPNAFNGRDLDHLGASNFNGGVHGTVTLFPGQGVAVPTKPAVGVTVFADSNNNGQQDLIRSIADPDDGIDPANLFELDGTPIPQVITNAFPGVTVTTADSSNNILTFEVTADRETNRFRPSNNRIFAHDGIDFFTNGQRLRFDLYRPAKEVSIEAIGAELGFSPTFGRLEAYNAAGDMLGFVRSGLLIGTLRETITFISAAEDIAYAVAYADDTFSNGSPFGRFDNFGFVQSEASGITDDEGNYEIKHLFPGNYNIGVLRNAQSDGFIADPPRPIRVTSNENFDFDFGLRPNVGPIVPETFLFTINENATTGTSVGTITSNDPDGQTLTYRLKSGAEFGLLLDSSTGQLTVGPNAVLDFEADSEYLIEVAVSDPFDFEVTTRVTVQLVDLNEPPVAEVGDFAVAEGTANGAAIGQIQAFDPDFQQNQTLTFQVIGGSGAGIFLVDPANGLITLADESAIDFELISEVNLVVRIFDSFNPSAEVIIDQPIRIVDQNDPPVITTTSFTVPENQLPGTVVGQIAVADPDRDQIHQFQFVGGTGADLFRVRRSGAIELRAGAKLDFESVSSYTLVVTAIDDGAPPLAGQATITMNILDVNEPPLLNPSTATLPENSQAGVLVATIVAEDPEGVGSGYVISLLSGSDAADFDFDPATGQLTVAEGATLDFETRPRKELRFQITDPSGNDQTTIETFVIDLIDQNDPPFLLTKFFIVSELARPGSRVGRVEVQVREEDVADNVSVAIVGGNAAALFNLDAQTRVLTVANGAQFDADVPGETLILQVEVTDQGGLSSVGEIEIRLNNVNEPPVFNFGAPNIAPIVSGQPFEFVITSEFITDPEGGPFELAIFDSNQSLPSWMKFNEVTRTLSGLPNPLLVGSYPLTLRAFEPGPVELFNQVNFTIVVNRGNTPLTNQRNRLDVDANRTVAPIDALKVINFIGRHGAGASVLDFLTAFTGFVDTSGDGFVTALDALLVINGIRQQAGATGELISDLDDVDETNDTALTELLSESSLF